VRRLFLLNCSFHLITRNKFPNIGNNQLTLQLTAVIFEINQAAYAKIFPGNLYSSPGSQL
jgi:hypothetical protein